MWKCPASAFHILNSNPDQTKFRRAGADLKQMGGDDGGFCVLISCQACPQCLRQKEHNDFQLVLFQALGSYGPKIVSICMPGYAWATLFKMAHCYEEFQSKREVRQRRLCPMGLSWVASKHSSLWFLPAVTKSSLLLQSKLAANSTEESCKEHENSSLSTICSLDTL